MKSHCNSTIIRPPTRQSESSHKRSTSESTANIGRRRRTRHSKPVQGQQHRFGMGQEQSSLIDDSTPPQTLKERSVESVATYIKQGRAKKIVVMVSPFSQERYNLELSNSGLIKSCIVWIVWGWHQHICWYSRFSIPRYRPLC